MLEGPLKWVAYAFHNWRIPASREGNILTTHKDIFTYGDHGSTFGGNYLSTRAALEVLDILEETKNSGKLDETIIYFQNKLDEVYKKYTNLFIRSVGLGLMRGLRVRDGETLAQIINEGFNERVLLLKAGKHTLRMLPPLTITKEEIDEGFKRLENALSKIN